MTQFIFQELDIIRTKKKTTVSYYLVFHFLGKYLPTAALVCQYYIMYCFVFMLSSFIMSLLPQNVEMW